MPVAKPPIASPSIRVPWVPMTRRPAISFVFGADRDEFELRDAGGRFRRRVAFDPQRFGDRRQRRFDPQSGRPRGHGGEGDVVDAAIVVPVGEFDRLPEGALFDTVTGRDR